MLRERLLHNFRRSFTLFPSHFPWTVQYFISSVMSSVPLYRVEPLRASLRDIQSTPTFAHAVTQAIWGITNQRLHHHINDYQSYFAHIYKDLTAAACSGDCQIPDATHEQILAIVQNLKLQPFTKSELQRSIHESSSNRYDDLQVERASILAAGLLVPLHFKAEGGARRGATITWEDDECLSQMVERAVVTRLKSSNAARNNCPSCSRIITKFPRTFNARQLTRMAGFQIIWTNNLLDHLLLEDDDGELKIFIFHQVKVLQNHLEFPKSVQR